MDAQELWGGLDEAWREAFRQGWDAVRGGNIGVGACASTVDGEIIHASRNRVNEKDGPHGEIFGSSLAHAEMNVLAVLGFRQHQNLVLTTTLQPCLQCAGAIRLARIGTVRFAGHDVYWDGYHDFGKLAVRERQRQRRPARRLGPRDDELGVFGLLMSRFTLGNPRRMTAASKPRCCRWAKGRCSTSRTRSKTAANCRALWPWELIRCSLPCGPASRGCQRNTGLYRPIPPGLYNPRRS